MLIEIPIFAALYAGGIAFATYSSVRRMAASPELVPAPELMARINPSLPEDVSRFLLTNGFRPLDCYRFHTVNLVIWERPGGPPLQRIFLSRTATGGSYEFVAVFSDTVSLTTSRSRSAFMFPRPFGGYLQAFPKCSIQELWEIHLKGTEHLISGGVVRSEECTRPFPERFRQGIAQQLSLVRSLPFWPVRGVYWFVVKRFLLQNRPIWKQDLARLYPPDRPVASHPA